MCLDLLEKAFQLSTSSPRLHTKALRKSVFLWGTLGLVSGLNAIKSAMSSATIRSVIALVRRLAAKALIRAGGNCRVAPDIYADDLTT